jgi:hypothetical protein
MSHPSSLDAVGQKIKEAAIAFYNRHETAIHRFIKPIEIEIVFVMWLIVWPYLYVGFYALFVSLALALWYGVARGVGLAVPAGSLFHAVWSYYKSPVPNAVINAGAMFIIAFWIFMVRIYYRAFYAFVEMIIGAIIASSVNLDDKDQLKVTLTLAGGIYVMVRGLDNLEKAYPNDSGLGVVLRYLAPFFRYYTIGDFLGNRNTTLEQAADPAYWRSVAGKDPLAAVPECQIEGDVSKSGSEPGNPDEPPA